MSLTTLMESYKNRMAPEQYAKFTIFVKQSVDLNAKNSSNFKSRDLAEYQIKQLAERYLK